MIQDRIKNTIENFELFDDWVDKYSYLIDLGKQLPDFPSEEKVEKNKILGCQSDVWLSYKLKDGKLFFYADSNALITKGIAAMLVDIYSDSYPKEIVETNTDFLDKIGLTSHLSPTRANGLAEMLNKIQQIAKNNL